MKQTANGNTESEIKRISKEDKRPSQFSHTDGTRISLCMIVCNEQDTLPHCLASVQGAVDEVIVVDTGSRDETVRIAHALGARVYNFAWQDDFACARNYAIERATGDWVLVLDADEQLAPGQKHVLQDMIANAGSANSEVSGGGKVDGYLLTLRNLVGDPVQPGVLIHHQLRLFRHSPEFRFIGAIHEQLPKLDSAHYVSASLTVIHRGYLDPLVRGQRKVERNLRILQRERVAVPQSPKVHYYLGNEWLRLREFVTAVAAYQRAEQCLGVAVDRPWLPDLPLKHAYALWQAGDAQTARQVLMKAYQVEPHYTDLWYLYGIICLTMADWPEAERAFRHCLQLGPAGPGYPSQEGCGDTLPAYVLGELCLQQGRLVEARENILQCLATQPDHVQARIALCQCDWRAGHPRVAGLGMARLSSDVRALAKQASWPFQALAEIYRSGLQDLIDCDVPQGEEQT